MKLSVLSSLHASIHTASYCSQPNSWQQVHLGSLSAWKSMNICSIKNHLWGLKKKSATCRFPDYWENIPGTFLEQKLKMKVKINKKKKLTNMHVTICIYMKWEMLFSWTAESFTSRDLFYHNFVPSSIKVLIQCQCFPLHQAAASP